MDRIIATLLILVALVLGACESTDTNLPDDTGDQAETITVTVEAYLDDVLVENQPVSIEDTASVLAEGLTGQALEVELRTEAMAQVWIGPTDADTTTDGHRIHTVGGTEYVHRDISVNTDTGSTPVVVDLNLYVRMANVICTVVDYIWYNEEWASPETYEYHGVNVDTMDGYHLIMDEDVLGMLIAYQEGEELVINGTSLTSEGPHSDEVTVQEFRYSPSEGTLHIITEWTEFAKSDLTCR